MPRKQPNKVQYTFQFDYTVSTAGVPQPYPVAQPKAKILIRCTPAEDENGRVYEVMNICGNREGLKHLAAMLVLCADSEQYDPEFHVHLEREREVDTDTEVTLRAPVYYDVLRKGEFREFKGTEIKLPQSTKRSQSTRSIRSAGRLRLKKRKTGD